MTIDSFNIVRQREGYVTNSQHADQIADHNQCHHKKQKRSGQQRAHFSEVYIVIDSCYDPDDQPIGHIGIWVVERRDRPSKPSTQTRAGILYDLRQCKRGCQVAISASHKLRMMSFRVAAPPENTVRGRDRIRVLSPSTAQAYAKPVERQCCSCEMK